jgi:hypothetical protein
MIRRFLMSFQLTYDVGYRPEGLVQVRPPTSPPAPGTGVAVEMPIVVAEIRPEVGVDWMGRLLCANDFASAAVKRFHDVAQIQADECPLCFRPFSEAVVWWTCGHVCAQIATPRFLRRKGDGVTTKTHDARCAAKGQILRTLSKSSSKTLFHPR